MQCSFLFFFFPSFETINNRASKQIWKFIFFTPIYLTVCQTFDWIGQEKREDRLINCRKVVGEFDQDSIFQRVCIKIHGTYRLIFQQVYFLNFESRHQDFVYAAAYNRPSFLPNKRFELLS